MKKTVLAILIALMLMVVSAVPSLAKGNAAITDRSTVSNDVYIIIDGGAIILDISMTGKVNTVLFPDGTLKMDLFEKFRFKYYEYGELIDKGNFTVQKIDNPQAGNGGVYVSRIITDYSFNEYYLVSTYVWANGEIRVDHTLEKAAN